MSEKNTHVVPDGSKEGHISAEDDEDLALASEAPATDAVRSEASQSDLGQTKTRGGPRTTVGKQSSSKNARRHGILSPDPSAGGESPKDYATFLAGLETHFQPVGMYEKELVAQVANEFWALHRITRAISALVDLRTERIDPPPRVSFMKPMHHSTKWSDYSRPFEAKSDLEYLESLIDKTILSSEIVDDVIRAIGAAGFVIPAHDPASCKPNNVRSLRKFLLETATINHEEVDQVVKSAAAVLQQVHDLAEGAADKVKRIRTDAASRAERAAASNLPALDDYGLLLRYKRAHERALEMWLGLLEASQRARSGDLAPPVRLHIS